MKKYLKNIVLQLTDTEIAIAAFLLTIAFGLVCLSVIIAAIWL